MSASEIEQRITTAKQAVLAETALMHREFGHAKPVIKHDGTKVTPVDIAISQHLQDAITQAFPSDQFFSEELAPTAEPVPLTSRFYISFLPVRGFKSFEFPVKTPEYTRAKYRSP